MPKAESAQRQWARLGAETRLQEIDEERASILAAFPELKREGRSVRLVSRAGGSTRRQMSAAAKRRMSEGMRKYWAKRKAQEKKST